MRTAFGVLAIGGAITMFALLANAQPVMRAPPSKPMPSKLAVMPKSKVTNCPDVGGGKQHCNLGDTCVTSPQNKLWYDCAKAGSKGKDTYPAIATCGLDTDCGFANACYEGKCVPYVSATKCGAGWCVTGKCTADKRCEFPGGFAPVIEALPGCGPQGTYAPCHGSGICGREACQCPPGGCKSCDNDRDGHNSIGCNGDDCDDNDPNRFPGNAELCTGDLAAHDEDCNPMTVVMPYYDQNDLFSGHHTDKGADKDVDGAVDVACTNPWPGPGEPPRQGYRTIYDPTSKRITGTDCDDTRSGYQWNGNQWCGGPKLQRQCGFKGAVPAGYKVNWPYIEKECPNGCLVQSNGGVQCN